MSNDITLDDLDNLDLGIFSGSSKCPSEILAYLAGIIDGEGCISILSQKRSGSGNKCHFLSIKCSMRDAPAINLLGQIFGGMCKPCAGKNKNDPNDIFYIWSVATVSAYNCLVQLVPYLRVKKYQAMVGIAFQKDCFIDNCYGNKEVPENQLALREAYKNELMRLKKVWLKS